MRTLALLAAFAVMHRTHALPRQDLTLRQGENDLANDRHIFHHLDRNPLTANHDRDRAHGDNAEGSGPYVVKRLPGRSQQAGGWTTARERVVHRRFIQDPDYSQGDSGGDSKSASPAVRTMSTQPRWRNREKQTTAMGDPEAKSQA